MYYMFGVFDVQDPLLLPQIYEIFPIPILIVSFIISGIENFSFSSSAFSKIKNERTRVNRHSTRNFIYFNIQTLILSIFRSVCVYEIWIYAESVSVLWLAMCFAVSVSELLVHEKSRDSIFYSTPISYSLLLKAL